MTNFKNIARLVLLTAIALLPFMQQAQAQQNHRPGTMDVTIIADYAFEQDFDFGGGASAELSDDWGFGFNMAYNINRNLAFRGGVLWHSTSYGGTRVLDDPGSPMNPIERFRGKMDTFDLNFGLDYYFLEGNKLRPFVSGEGGWSWIDTNIPAGPPQTICWYDPWLGYICSAFQNTYGQTSFFYGAGIGLRYNFNNNNFMKVGYYNHWLDVDNASNDEMDFLRLEFGWAF